MTQIDSGGTVTGVRDQPCCPRCGDSLTPPGWTSSSWTCRSHGAVPPLQVPHPPSVAWLADLAGRSTVPVWVPWPLPAAWLLTGEAEVSGPKQKPVASVVAFSGPNPAPRPGVAGEQAADLLVVAESPGVGLGARLAGLDDVDPGEAVTAGPPHAKVRARGQHTPLWHVDGQPDRAAFVGESTGVWLWLVVWPASAAVLMLEPLDLVDVRDGGPALNPPVGAPSPRLV